MAYAVIGSNWGDEGKGLATDAIAAWLIASGARPVVVRSNGGGQAGHTVEDPASGRHVFSQVGAGTLAGASSHMSRFFVFEPRGAAREIDALRRMTGLSPDVSIDPRAQVTTPWDIMINQIAETSRSARHGSCGLGFGETVGRGLNGPAITVSDLFGVGLEDKLRDLRDNWAPSRVSEMGLTVPETMADAFVSEDLLRDWVRGARDAALNYRVMSDDELGGVDEVVFEGAQGLALDMFSDDFPHVTRSETGLANMIRIARSAGIDRIDATYMTRAYATRHGAGPLPMEGEQGPLRFRDETNAPNDWQGAIRIGALDASGMATRIRKDLRIARSGKVRVSAALGVTCIDQIEAFARISGTRVGAEVVAEELSAAISLPLRLTSEGPTRSQVRFTCP